MSTLGYVIVSILSGLGVGGLSIIFSWILVWGPYGNGRGGSGALGSIVLCAITGVISAFVGLICTLVYLKQFWTTWS